MYLYEQPVSSYEELISCYVYIMKNSCPCMKSSCPCMKNSKYEQLVYVHVFCSWDMCQKKQTLGWKDNPAALGFVLEVGTEIDSSCKMQVYM